MRFTKTWEVNPLDQFQMYGYSEEHDVWGMFPITVLSIGETMVEYYHNDDSSVTYWLAFEEFFEKAFVEPEVTVD